MRTLYVGGLPPDTNSSALRSLFASFGPLVDARVIMRPNTSRCRGFGYVTFETRAAARRAREALDGWTYRDAPLRVAEAT